MKYFVRAASLIFCLVTCACSQIAFATANLPTQFDNMTVIHDVAFGTDTTQKLDIYIPENVTANTDVVVFFYGGRWTYGSKDNYRFAADAFVNKGFIVVIPDYRKYPNVHFPVFVQDGAKALAWTYDHIAAYHGNPKRIHVAGHSAGAHIGALLTADPSYLAHEGKKRSAVIHDFAGLAGPYAFTPDEPDLEDMFGPPANYPKMNVTTFIDGKQPPMLLLYGDKDVAVKLSNLEKTANAIKTKGGCVETKIYPGIDHSGIMGALSWHNPHEIPVVDDMATFFRDGCG